MDVCRAARAYPGAKSALRTGASRSCCTATVVRSCLALLGAFSATESTVHAIGIGVGGGSVEPARAVGTAPHRPGRASRASCLHAFARANVWTTCERACGVRVTRANVHTLFAVGTTKVDAARFGASNRKL